jgi:hypothetical protein
MLWFAVAAAFIGSPPHGPAPRGPVVQARATVRIVSGARVRFGEGASSDVPASHERWIRTTMGIQPAKLIEFE